MKDLVANGCPGHLERVWWTRGIVATMPGTFKVGHPQCKDRDPNGPQTVQIGRNQDSDGLSNLAKVT